MTDKEKVIMEKGFVQGYTLACAEIMRTHGEDTVCYDLLGSSTYKPDELRKHGCEEADIKVLMPIIMVLLAEELLRGKG